MMRLPTAQFYYYNLSIEAVGFGSFKAERYHGLKLLYFGHLPAQRKENTNCQIYQPPISKQMLALLPKPS